MKLLVETTGPFLLVQTTTGMEVPYNRPCVILADGWFQNQVALGQVKTLSNPLPENETDADFLGYWKECDGDREMAVQSFLSQFELKVEPPPAP